MPNSLLPNGAGNDYHAVQTTVRVRVLSRRAQELQESAKLWTDKVKIGSLDINDDASTDGCGDLPKLLELEGRLPRNRIPLELAPCFEYPPLPRGHARFLRMLGAGPYPIGYLEHHSLDHPPPYSAISYCWGTKKMKRAMFLDDTTFMLSETVIGVLNQVVGFGATEIRESTHLVWIDQICINQRDDAEKMDQIHRMGDIYSKADKVIIWLGATSDSSDKVIEKLPETWEAAKTWRNLKENGAKYFALPHFDSNLLPYYGLFFARPWFRRLWTVQETLLAKDLLVVCGCRNVHWDVLTDFARVLMGDWFYMLLKGSSLAAAQVRQGLSAIITLQHFRELGSVVNGFDIPRFIQLLEHTRTREVTNPEDRIWALQGIAPSAVHKAVASFSRPEVAGNYWETYIKFAKVIIEQDNILSFLGMTPPEQQPSQLPSWCPNLNSPPQAATFSLRIVGLWRPYAAGILGDSTSRRKLSWDLSSNILMIRGFRVDRVDKIVKSPTVLREPTLATNDKGIFEIAK